MDVHFVAYDNSINVSDRLILQELFVHLGVQNQLLFQRLIGITDRNLPFSVACKAVIAALRLRYLAGAGRSLIESALLTGSYKPR